jgi:hypothetical protein
MHLVSFCRVRKLQEITGRDLKRMERKGGFKVLTLENRSEIALPIHDSPERRANLPR